ncbi:acVLRF1 family peptidyl-tRNA hydrolase [Herbidospora daliensis]|uniref:acVLRF1 family peptidyl-tRNA hydrolase n=1 Tax=Herbidospora daliensis TaxID=295585 RepID=UPI0007811655|nr:acVLRF1 family peptidyl-tRNA hydrolase [Herbidospora daliensis]
MSARPAAGGGRWVSIPPSRLPRWLANFAARHGGPPSEEGGPDLVVLTAPDGAVAECHVPFGPLECAASPPPPEKPATPDAGRDDGPGGPLAAALISHVSRDRRVAVLLVRLGGYAAGVFEGDRLLVSKVGSRLVHGRSAAGGWSQQRFARRREKQADEALGAAADVAARVLLPPAGEGLAGFVVGGDRKAIDELRGDRRLAPLFALETGPFLTVPDPRLAVLEKTPEEFRAVRIRVVDPA